jgi:ABC-2 type transport system ATP-binding protein
MTKDTVVEFRDVTFSYDRAEALHQISLTLRRGEIVGLLGPNGAGKSTSIKIMAGILSASAGTVEVLGRPMPHQAAAVKERIGYVPETPTLFESLTGEEFMELCGRLHGLDEPVLQTRLTTILEAFQLGADRLGRIESYSKGMRQKVLIGAALLHNPELLLLDEPLSGLDVHSALMVKDLLAALAAEGKTVLYSSHVLDVVERVCDRAIIIHRGRIIAEGSVADLKKSAGRESLEEVFRTLTETGTLETGVRSIVDALRG